MNNYSVGISGVGSFVPEKILTNQKLSQMVDTSNEWIVERTGIHERRIVEGHISTSDLGTEAAKRALEDANLKPEDIDLIIVATITPDHLFPSTACIIQNNLGAVNASAFDINAACTGFIYGVVTGAGFIKSGNYKRVLVIGSETLSKIIDWEDRNTCVLFGDGAGACILERCDEEYGILAYELGADGKNRDVLIQPAGGSRIPITMENIERKLHTLKMDGKEVFKFAVRTMEKSTLSVLGKANMNIDELDFLVPHQANIRIIDAARKKLNLSMKKIFVNLNKYGNMSSASVPVALDEAIKEKKIKKGDKVLLIAFGAGLTWGSIILKWNREEDNV